MCVFFFSSRRRHTRSDRDWSSDVCSSDLDLGETVRGADVVVSSAPSHVVREVMGRVGAALSRGTLVVSVSKGLEPERLTTLSCVLGEVLPRGVPIAVLSGPSFAQEVFQQQPTAVVAAAQDHGVARQGQQVFSTNYFRGYSHTDVLGVELRGALQDLVARAAVTLGARHGVELPIAGQVAAVLFGGKPPRQAVADLMERELKAEQWSGAGSSR